MDSLVEMSDFLTRKINKTFLKPIMILGTSYLLRLYLFF